MSTFFYAQNLTKRSMESTVAPWDFKATEIITDEIRLDKQARQKWYHDQGTNHYFYTGVEASNPNQRISKTDNPPRCIRAFAADFDLKMSDQRIDEAIAAMKIKPAAVERSLGGNTRLVWLLPAPLGVDSYDFCAFVLRKAVKWLKMDLLPGLDESAFTDPSRLLCNGGIWKATNHALVPADDLQAFFVECGQEFKFKSCVGAEIPLEEVEKGLRAKFPGFTWQGDFTLESQGPSFWLPNSTSTMSAIVKKDGMFTFSGSAEKPFYSWSDILGADFAKSFAVSAISKATDDIHWDGKQYWRKIGGLYKGIDSAEMMNYFEVSCGLSTKSERGAVSGLKKAMAHIFENNRIEGAAPFVGRAPGRIIYKGEPVLNTYVHCIVRPAIEWTPWGEKGGFPFLSRYFDALLEPHEQLIFLLAWFKHFYVSMLEMRPMAGQNVFLMGPAGAGKTLGSRRVFGAAVGGALDAGEFLTSRSNFNSQMFHKAYWGIDDETMGESSNTQTFFHAAIKKFTANQEFMSHKKYGQPTMTEWLGRIVVTANMDHVSSRCLGGMDNSSRDKTSLFRCSGEKKIVFPTKHVLEPLIDAELPYFLKFIVDLEVPDHVPRDVRYGFASYHEPALLDKAHQSGKSAPFKELLIEALAIHFNDNPSHPVWRGTTTALMRLMNANPHNDFVMRSMKLEQTNRYLEMIQREGLIKCGVETGPLKTRLWVFHRFDDTTTPAPAAPETTDSNPFAK